MAQKFKNQIDAQEGIKITNELYDGSNAAGNSGQVLSSTGSATQWIDLNADSAKRLEVDVKNVHGATLAKGTVVHAQPTGTLSGNIIEVVAADANTKMPAIGVLNETLLDDGEGKAVMFGTVQGIDTSGFSVGDELYVSATAGDFTATKPTATNEEVQKIAIVVKSHASNGLIKVFGAGRANDVPNTIDRNVTWTGGDLYFDNTIQARFKTNGGDIGLRIQSSGTNSFIDNEIDNLYIRQKADDKDIIFQSDDGSGGITTYFRLDGSAATHDGVNTTALYTWWEDNSRIALGASKDLQIYHDGSHSYVDDNGVGNLRLRGNAGVQIMKAASTEIMGEFIADGAVNLYYDNSKKFETTSTGVTVTGNATLSSTAPILYLANTTSSTGKTWRFSSAANGNAYITQDGVIDAITLSHTSGNATFAGDVTIGGKTYPKLNLTDNQGVARNFSVGTNNETFTVRNETAGSDALTISNANDATFTGAAYVVGNLGIGTAVADSPIHVSKGGLNTTGQDYGVHIGVLESGANRYSAIELVSNGALSGWIDFSNTDSANDYNERIRGGDGTLRFFSSGEEAAYIDSSQHTNFNEDIIVTSNDHNITTIEANENSTHFGRLHYMHSDFTTSGTNIADSLLLVASSESTGGIVIRADKPGSEILFAIGDSTATNTVMKITDGANGVEFFPTTTAEGGHIALRADTDGSYRYAIDNYNDTLRIVRQADADATGGAVVANVDGNGDFAVLRDFTAGRTGYFTSNSADSRVLYLDQHAADNGNIIQFRDNAETYVWELVGRNNQFYIYNNSLSKYSLYIEPTNNRIGINGNSTPKALLHITDGTNSYPTDANNKLVVESDGHTYIGLGGGDASDVGIHFGDSTAVNRGRLAYIHSEDAMKISTSSAVRYILDGGGNVGYNSPVKASTGTWRNFGFGSLRMFGRADANNPDGGIGTNFYFNTANEELRVSAHAASRIWFNDDVINFDNAGTGLIDSAITWNNRMKIDASGNTMIGKADQSGNAVLTVKSTAGGNTGIMLIEGDTTNDGHGLYATTENKFIITRFTDGSYSDHFVMDSTGKVGIGLAEPEHKLVVGGSIGFGDGTYNGGVYMRNSSATGDVDENWGLEVQRTADTDDYNTRLKYYPVNGTSRKAGIWNSRDDKFSIYSNDDTEPDVIIPYGLLGIGSTNPGRGLTIDKSNEFSSLEIIKSNSGNQIVYLGTGSSGAGENPILQLKEGTVEKIRLYSTGTSWIAGGNLVIGNTSSTYDFEVYGTDAQIFAHYPSNSRGGIMALSSQRVAFTTTGDVDDLVFGYNSSTDVSSANFVERMRIDNGTGYVGIANSSPGAFLNIGTYNVAGKYINQTTYPTTPSEHLLHLTAPSTTNRYGGGISWGETTFSAANIVAIDAGGGGALHLAFGTGDSPNGVTERLRIDNGGTVIAKAELRANTSVRVFGNNVSDISATNVPTTTSANIGTYLNEYSFIDLSSSNAGGSWIDFSNANGTDYGGRIRYNFTNSRMSFSAGTGERFRVNVGTTTALNTLEAAQSSIASTNIGGASFSWGGNDGYPTIYGSASDRWVMFTFPHIACLQNGVNGHTGTSTGAKIRFASNPAASSSWDAGVDLQYNAADRFSIARAGAIMINCLPPNSTYSGLASRDWTIFGSGSRAGAIAINDVAGANYAISGGGYDLTFYKSVNGTSLASALTILGDNAADSTPDIQIHNNLTVNGTASVDGTASIGNAATIDSNTSSRVLYLRQHAASAGNIIQFQDQSANNTWELVGRNNIFYLYNNMNSVGYVLNVRADNGYIKIGNSNNASYHLDVEGTIRASSDVIAFSDKRVKENIVTIDSALDKVTKLRGVTYARKDIDDKSTKVGVIAQEVLEVLPEVVSKDDEGMYSVAYGNMAGVFIEAIKELKAEVDSLKEQLKNK